MLNTAVQASVDQIAAVVRDTYDLWDVDLHDDKQRRAIQATWLLVTANQHALLWILAGIDEAIQGS